jgi:hypothetical protein
VRQPIRPNQLAQELGITGLRLRNFLRAAHPRDDSMKGAAWVLTPDQVAAARDYFTERRLARAGAAIPVASAGAAPVESIKSTPPAPPLPEREW